MSNYENDPRVWALDKKGYVSDAEKMILVVRVCNEDDEDDFEPGPDTVDVPAKWNVCDVCRGRGKHVDPGVDCQGLTAEDFHDDPDFAEAYHRGDYDQDCNECGGRTTILVAEDNLSDEQKAAMEYLYNWQADMASFRAEEAAERRMGA